MTTAARTTQAHNKFLKTTAAVAISLALLATAGCSKLRARDQLNKGVQAYKASRYEKAVEHFKNAADLDPNLDTARLYLATACVAQFIPGASGEENTRFANCAIEEYKKVLDSKPKKNIGILAIKGLASLYFQMKNFDEARRYNEQAIQADPNDPENYYSIGVIDWTQTYLPRMEKRNALGLKQDDPIKDKKVCEEVKTMNSAKVEDGIDKLNKAIGLRKDYNDAMAYLNLMYRERADTRCEDTEARKADLAEADKWVEEAKRVMVEKAKKASEQTGIVLDENKEGQQ